MELSLFVKALGIGFAVAAPVGPMSLLCMKTTLARGWRQGMAIGGGIAVGDALFAAVAALGLAGLSHFMLAYEKPLHVAAGLFLLYLGLIAFRTKSNASAETAMSARGWRRDFAVSVLLTLTNPPTIIMFAAVFSALAPSEGFSSAGAAATAAGVLAGSLLWWCLLVLFASSLRHAIGRKARRWIDFVSGALLGGLGAAELHRGLMVVK